MRKAFCSVTVRVCVPKLYNSMVRGKVADFRRKSARKFLRNNTAKLLKTQTESPHWSNEIGLIQSNPLNWVDQIGFMHASMERLLDLKLYPDQYNILFLPVQYHIASIIIYYWRIATREKYAYCSRLCIRLHGVSLPLR